MLIVCRPIPLENPSVIIQLQNLLKKSTGLEASVQVRFSRISHTLTKLTSIYRQGWDPDPEAREPRKKKVVPRESLVVKKEMHRCYHDGKWGVREHPDALLNSDWEFGIAIVTVEHWDYERIRIDYAIEELNGTWYISFDPPLTPILY